MTFNTKQLADLDESNVKTGNTVRLLMARMFKLRGKNSPLLDVCCGFQEQLDTLRDIVGSLTREVFVEPDGDEPESQLQPREWTTHELATHLLQLPDVPLVGTIVGRSNATEVTSALTVQHNKPQGTWEEGASVGVLWWPSDTPESTTTQD